MTGCGRSRKPRPRGIASGTNSVAGRPVPIRVPLRQRRPQRTTGDSSKQRVMLVRCTYGVRIVTRGLTHSHGRPPNPFVHEPNTPMCRACTHRRSRASQPLLLVAPSEAFLPTR
ncbi:hypothetical protein MTO96_001122 [Rhipicephalus appendiculatus]